MAVRAWTIEEAPLGPLTWEAVPPNHRIARDQNVNVRMVVNTKAIIQAVKQGLP